MSHRGTSHAEILNWFRTQLAGQDEEKDTLIYHSPLPPYRTYQPEQFSASTIILSLTPTEGVYEQLHSNPRARKVLFLHRPWTLDRIRVPRGTLVLQSHLKFDEIYTTGYNLAFATKFNVNLNTIQCLQGYKGDPDRRIGLLGELTSPASLKDYMAAITDDFQGSELQETTTETDSTLQAIASLNAFDEDIIQRIQAALPDIPCDKILCITGAAREAGLAAAKACGMQVLCVGHRRSEMWGIRYLASKIGADLKLRDVHIVDEPDVVVEKKAKKTPTKEKTDGGSGGGGLSVTADANGGDSVPAGVV